MSVPPLSPVQRRAVEHPLADALVTAGAGSGKTRVLSERYVHIVHTHDVAMRRLAALTFTEKAAAEMRTRIADIFRHGGDEAGRADVEFAPISTIHAFCALLLRQHAVEAGVDPSFQVLDPVEAQLLREDAAALAERGLAHERPELVEVFDSLGWQPRVVLLGVLDALRVAGHSPDALTWKDGEADPAAAAADVRNALDGFAGLGGLLPEARRPLHADAIDRAHALLAQVDGGEELAPFFAAQVKAAVVGLKGPKKGGYPAARAALERALARLSGALLDDWGAAHLLPAVQAVLSAYDTTYAELKHERSALDFSDLELRARDLLHRAAERNQPLDLAPHALLVDEYQDTNPLQAEILDLLRARAPQFAVGDPKQSIYSFRGADVEVILRERERVGAASRYAMNASYRACPELVAAVNAVNMRLFADDAAGVAYEPLEAAASYLPAEAPPFEFTLVDAGSRVAADTGRELEAAWIAGRIAELADGATLRTTPRRDRTGAPTGESEGPVSYGDIAILFRAAPRDKLAIYEAALEARGIPFLTQKSSGFFQADEIEDLLHILRAVHNPKDAYALACVATGPAMAATDEDLFRWFAPGERPPWDRMRDEARAGSPHAGAVRTLEALRTEAAAGSLAGAVERALDDLGLLEIALLGPSGDRRAANLRKAVEIARRLDRGGRRGLADLLRHLETLRLQEVGEAEAPIGGEADDVVRITTVHGAKGLEYPIVFVADVGRPGGGGTPAIRYDGDRAVAVRVRDPVEGVGCIPAGYALLADREKEAGAREEQRVLYVATTRAAERLVMSGWCAGGRAADGVPSGFTQWGGQVWRVLGAPFEPGRHDVTLDDACVRVTVVDGSSLEVPRVPAAPAARSEASPEAEAEARRLLARAQRPTAPLGDTRFVVSVSELLAFAESPQTFYVDRVVYRGAGELVSAAWDTPAGEGAPQPDRDPESGRRADAAAGWDEGRDHAHGLDRAAVGRAVHAVIEGLRARHEDVPEDLLRAAADAEGGDPALVELVRTMARRYLACPTGRRMREALSRGEDVRREVALHARIRFPGKQAVGGFEALLVKGSIDLWLPSPEGVWIVDHKTNRAGGRFRAPEALAAHYAWQLRLYALAAERVLGADVAGARLVLLDPGWGEEAVEVEVDVAGDRLEETRRLCQAFASAELEGRYPQDWRELLQ